MSLGHLTDTFFTPKLSRASAMARQAISEMTNCSLIGRNDGRSSMLNAMLQSFCDSQLLPI